MTELGGLPQVAAPPAVAPSVGPPAASPVTAMPPVAVASGVAPGTIAAPGAATAPAPASAPGTVAGSAAPATTGAAGFAPPYAVGPPRIDVGSGQRTGAIASSSAKRKASQPDSASAPAAREAARARRRRRAKQHGHGDEFANMDVELEPDWATPDEEPALASDVGTGVMGFAGTVSKGAAPAVGLTTLSGDEFGGGPRAPMPPNTWRAEGPEAEPADG